MSLHTKKQTKVVQRHITDILNDKATVFLYNIIGDKMLVCNTYRIRMLYRDSERETMCLCLKHCF